MNHTARPEREYVCAACGRLLGYARTPQPDAVSCPGCGGLALPLPVVDSDEIAAPPSVGDESGRGVAGESAAPVDPAWRYAPERGAFVYKPGRERPCPRCGAPLEGAHVEELLGALFDCPRCGSIDALEVWDAPLPPKPPHYELEGETALEQADPEATRARHESADPETQAAAEEWAARNSEAMAEAVARHNRPRLVEAESSAGSAALSSSRLDNRASRRGLPLAAEGAGGDGERPRPYVVERGALGVQDGPYSWLGGPPAEPLKTRNESTRSRRSRTNWWFYLNFQWGALQGASYGSRAARVFRALRARFRARGSN